MDSQQNQQPGKHLGVCSQALQFAKRFHNELTQQAICEGHRELAEPAICETTGREELVIASSLSLHRDLSHQTQLSAICHWLHLGTNQCNPNWSLEQCTHHQDIKSDSSQNLSCQILPAYSSNFSLPRRSISLGWRRRKQKLK